MLGIVMSYCALPLLTRVASRLRCCRYAVALAGGTPIAPPVPIAADVRDWLGGVFAGCNERIAGTITQVPTTHEGPLDVTFIQHFLGVSGPRRFLSGWTVEVSTHYLGGRRHYAEWGDWPRRWEITDIRPLVIFRQAASCSGLRWPAEQAAVPGRAGT